MNILITGNLGYIGMNLSEKLINLKYKVIGLDTSFYLENKNLINKNLIQRIKDVRLVQENDLEGIDIVIHLAALSNDPLGELSPNLTSEINYKATINIAELSKKKGVKKFIFISSQSMYGVSNSQKELDEDNSDKKPVTEYAKTKWQAELELKKISTDDFCISYLRPSTVFGVSSMLRLDIVYNNLLASAFTKNKIEILSDGSPWRPTVHIDDLCDAILSLIKAPSSKINNVAYNVGVPNGNYSIKDLAIMVNKLFPKSELVFKNLETDPRTYKVNFNRINTELKEYFSPIWTLEKGGIELIKYFNKIKLNEIDFKSRKFNRIKQLNFLMKNKKINKNLYWN
tara:strand:+ start:252 stop:1277 length:1026 start_codon:yes stop_codon:yes gene_type:complete